MKTLVIGGTGKVGSMVVAGLLKQGIMVRVMSHSPDKLKKLPAGVERLEGYRADLDDPDTLPEAFKSIDSVFLLNTVGPNETDEGLSAVSAAKDAKVKKIVYMSVAMPAGSEIIPHFGANSRGEGCQGLGDRLHDPQAEQLLPERPLAEGRDHAVRHLSAAHRHEMG
jgi:uncharacterized protein YbjT (DUF2867 family)